MNTEYLMHYNKVRVAVEGLVASTGYDPATAWGTMTYGCMGLRPTPGSEGCGFEHTVYLGLGIEGPAVLRDADAIIPSPAFCGSCPKCGGSLGHTDWNRDETFALPVPVPDTAARFRVPTPEEARTLAAVNYGGAEYEDPSGETTSRQRRPNRAQRRGGDR